MTSPGMMSWDLRALISGVGMLLISWFVTPGAMAADGKAIYAQTCAACHVSGVADAPKLGDKVAWTPRLKLGQQALIASVLKGKGAMPAKGGNASLSDSDVKLAVEYMVSQVR